jgi:hypothetical protein
MFGSKLEAYPCLGEILEFLWNLKKRQLVHACYRLYTLVTGCICLLQLVNVCYSLYTLVTASTQLLQLVHACYSFTSFLVCTRLLQLAIDYECLL